MPKTSLRTWRKRAGGALLRLRQNQQLLLEAFADRICSASLFTRLRIDTFRLFEVPCRQCSLPLQRCTIPLRSASIYHRSSQGLAAIQDKPVIRDKFLSKPAEMQPGAVTVPNGCASFQGAIVNAHGELVNPKELDQECFLRNSKTTSLLPARRTVDGVVLTLAHRWQNNYFHWLFDVLPKLAVAEALEIRFSYLHIARRAAYQQQALELLKIDPSIVIASQPGEQLQAHSLVAITTQDAFTNIPTWTCQFLRDRFLPIPATRRGERLYVSRADAPRRRIRNEPQVIAWLTAMGFRIVEAGKLDFASQIQLFAAADIVVAAHGAGLANMVFCAPGTAVIEYMAPRYVFGCWHNLADRCGLDYHLIGGPDLDLEIDHGWSYQKEDFDLDLPRLQAVVTSLLRS